TTPLRMPALLAQNKGNGPALKASPSRETQCAPSRLAAFLHGCHSLLGFIHAVEFSHRLHAIRDVVHGLTFVAFGVEHNVDFFGQSWSYKRSNENPCDEILFHDYLLEKINTHDQVLTCKGPFLATQRREVNVISEWSTGLYPTRPPRQRLSRRYGAQTY